MVGEDIAVDLGSVLRTAIRVVNAAFRWPPCSDSRLQRCSRKAGIDRAADRIANNAARPGIQDGRQIDEARRNGDVGNIRDPELVRAIDDPVAGEVREDRIVVIAVSRGNKPLAALGLQVVLASTVRGSLHPEAGQNRGLKLSISGGALHLSIRAMSPLPALPTEIAT